MKKRTAVALFVILALLVNARFVFAQAANQKLPRPFPAVGAQIGLHETVGVNQNFCWGESGLKGTAGGLAYVLSNNHVLGANNGGGMEVDQPGLTLPACQGNSSCQFGVVHSYINLVPGYLYNLTDAGLSTATPTTGTTNNVIYGFSPKTISREVQTTPVIGETVGFINSQAAVNGFSNFIVCSIVSVTATASVDYSCAAEGSPGDPCCFAIPPGNPVGFINQITLQCPIPALALKGDSGSVIFSAYDVCNMPISIQWGAQPEGANSLVFSAPILVTLQNLGVNIGGNNTCTSNPPHGAVLAGNTLTPKFLLAQFNPSDASDPDHIYLHPGDPDFNPNEQSAEIPMPTAPSWPPVSPDDEAKDKMIGQTISSPAFEATRNQWEAALGVPIVFMGGFVEAPGSPLKFVVGVDAQGAPIPDVLPHSFMGAPVEVRDVPPIQPNVAHSSLPKQR